MPNCPNCPGMLAAAPIGEPCPVCGKEIIDPDAPPPRKLLPIQECQRCKQKRVARVFIEADDMATVEMGPYLLDQDYLPDDMGIGAIEFYFCLECGQIQGKWPRPKTVLEGAEEKEEEE